MYLTTYLIDYEPMLKRTSLCAAVKRASAYAPSQTMSSRGKLASPLTRTGPLYPPAEPQGEMPLPRFKLSWDTQAKSVGDGGGAAVGPDAATPALTAEQRALLLKGMHRAAMSPSQPTRPTYTEPPQEAPAAPATAAAAATTAATPPPTDGGRTVVDGGNETAAEFDIGDGGEAERTNKQTRMEMELLRRSVTPKNWRRFLDMLAQVSAHPDFDKFSKDMTLPQLYKWLLKEQRRATFQRRLRKSAGLAFSLVGLYAVIWPYVFFNNS